MLAEHQTARENGRALADSLNIDPAPSAVHTDLRARAEAVVDQLHAAADADVDALYINSQVMMHNEALVLIDDLIASADAVELDTWLATLRAAVMEHRDDAVKLQQAAATQ
jgi:putative membrane protein